MTSVPSYFLLLSKCLSDLLREGSIEGKLDHLVNWGIISLSEENVVWLVGQYGGGGGGGTWEFWSCHPPKATYLALLPPLYFFFGIQQENLFVDISSLNPLSGWKALFLPWHPGLQGWVFKQPKGNLFQC